MFEYLLGKVTEIDENRIVLEVNNIGYIIYIPLRNISSLEEGKEYKIYVYRYLHENGEEIYGFLDKDSKKIFSELVKINGVGPKIAIKILSYLSPSEIIKAVTTNKIEILSSVKGISEKNAERITRELKNSIHKLGIKVEQDESIFDDLVKALRGLGYNQNDILFAINKAKKQNPKLLYLDISEALQLCLNVIRNK
ncbi:MAG: Holliday junction branch migration protein RuvA [Brevinematia bacterium]